MEPVKLAVERLSKVYGPHPHAALAAAAGGDAASGAHRGRHVVALRGVSFEVRRGEIFMVMGLSGSGKSTLVRCINRLIEPTGGSVRIDGQDVSAMNERELRELRRHKVGMVFQGFALLPHRTVLENVAYGLEIQGEPRATRLRRAQEVLELVGLKGSGDRYPDELSGGMQQRVGLARALATDPDLLLMDEPFSALDPLIRRRMQDELLDLQERVHKTILFITHDLDEALKLGQRVAIMKDGQVVQIGTPEDILLHPADDYVASFVEGVDRSKVLRARDVMFMPTWLLRRGQHPRVALHEMERAALSSAYVVGPQQRLHGLLTAGAALAALQRGAKDLSELALVAPVVVSPEQPLRGLIPMAVETPYPIAVADDDGRLLGIVARVSILGALGDGCALTGGETDEAAVGQEPMHVAERRLRP